MCRPRQYQAFVFVRGVFAGLLSPEMMGSRTDGALSQVFLQGNDRMTAEYVRYRGGSAVLPVEQDKRCVRNRQRWAGPAPRVRIHFAQQVVLGRPALANSKPHRTGWVGLTSL